MELFTKNMIVVGIIVFFFGRVIKPLFKKESARKWLLPLALALAGAGINCLITLLDGGDMWGTAILQGIFASICSQFLYDKYKDILACERKK